MNESEIDQLEIALDHLDDASSDLRWVIRSPSAAQRASAAHAACAAIAKAQDIVDKILSDILETATS